MEGNEMSAAAQLQRDWKFEDLESLPDDVDWRGFEIIDGGLVMSPSTSSQHEIVSALLRRVLDDAGLPEFLTIGPIAVDLAPSYLIPDLVVISTELRREDFNPWPAGAALSVVEVVSRSSRTKDRVLKPALYAEGGIRTYLRIETEPHVALTAYDLPPGASVYRELGTWGPGEVAHLDAPFAVDIPIDAITP